MKAKRCLECGAALPSSVAGGLCSACALRGALASGGDEAPTTPGPEVTGSATAIPPTGRGQRFGDYELLDEIARGGMGVVYRARQITLDRVVAVKMLLPGLSSSEYLRRFRTEASAAAGLQHPYIVAIHEVGAWRGDQYLVMDYVEGRSLAQLITDRGAPSPDFRQSARWMKAISEAVQYAHDHGILHRDLKPSNVLIDALGQPRVTDFGLAKRFEAESQLTLSGQVLGSPSYMPPEQAGARRGKVSRRSDVYGLGATLYHVLTGRAPFQGGTPTEVLHQVLNNDPVAPRLLNPGIPRDLETICLKCLEKDPARRYATVQMVVEELGRFLEDKPIMARPVGAAEKLWRWCKRKPVVAGLAGGLVFALALGFAGVLWQWQRAERISHHEAQQRMRAEASEYVFAMNLAQQALESSHLGRARSLIRKYLPAHRRESEVDLRGWEWRYLWPFCQSAALSTLGQLSHGAGSVVFTPDGRALAARDAMTSDVIFWDVAGRRAQGTLLGGSGSLRALALSPNGDWLAVGGQMTNSTPSVDLWEMPARRLAAQLPLGGGALSLAFSLDARALAVLGQDRTVQVWNLRTNHVVATYTIPEVSGSHKGTVAFSPDGGTLAIGDAGGRLRFISWPAGTERTNFQAHAASEGITALAFSAESQLLASSSGYADTVIRLWDVETGRGVGQLAGHKAYVFCLVLAPDGKTLASASADQTIRLWDLPRKQALGTLRGHLTEVFCAAFSPDGKTLVSLCKDGSILVWDPNRKQEELYTVTLPMPIRQVAFSPDSRTFTTLNQDGSITFWDAPSAQPTVTPRALGTNNACLALSPNGHLLVAGDTGGRIRIWNLSANGEITNFAAHATQVSDLRFAAAGRVLLTAAAQSRTVKAWDVDSWREQDACELDEEPWTAFDATADGHLVAEGLRDLTVKIWNLSTGRLEATLTGQKDVISAVAFSPDGKFLATASYDSSVKLYETATWRAVATLRGHLRAVHSAAFAPDGRRLATGGDLDDAVVLWDLGTLQEVCALRSEGTVCWFTVFSPDGNTLVSASRQGTAYLWRAKTLAEIDALEQAQSTAP